MTAAPGVYPGLTPSPEGEEIKRGQVDIFSPLPIPPSVTDVDAAMGPTGKLVMYLISNKTDPTAKRQQFKSRTTGFGAASFEGCGLLRCSLLMTEI